MMQNRVKNINADIIKTADVLTVRVVDSANRNIKFLSKEQLASLGLAKDKSLDTLHKINYNTAPTENNTISGYLKQLYENNKLLVEHREAVLKIQGIL